MEAWQLERAGDDAAAARLYLDWTGDHAADPSMLAGYAGFLRTERDLDVLVDAGRDFAESLPRLPGAWPLVDATARLFELAGLDEEAAEAAEDAWERGGPASLLQRAMRLRLAMGDLEGYEAAAARAVTLPDLDPLAVTADLLSGRLDEASTGAERILTGVPDAGAKLLAAWELLEVTRISGDASAAARAAARLAELFPGSPEALIAMATSTGAPSRVIEAPSPAMFASPAPEATVAGFAVQAGSFKVRENADELIKDLRRAGFEATILEVVLQGTTLWRVLAGTGLDRASAEDLVGRLQAAGYAGIVVGG